VNDQSIKRWVDRAWAVLSQAQCTNAGAVLVAHCHLLAVLTDLYPGLNLEAVAAELSDILDRWYPGLFDAAIEKGWHERADGLVVQIMAALDGGRLGPEDAIEVAYWVYLCALSPVAKDKARLDGFQAAIMDFLGRHTGRAVAVRDGAHRAGPL
jgi:hypothetical protein